MSQSLNLTKAEIERAAGALPFVLTVDQAASLIQIPKRTIYEWNSAGRLASCARRRGKHLLIFRDRFIEEMFNGKEW